MAEGHPNPKDLNYFEEIGTISKKLQCFAQQNPVLYTVDGLQYVVGAAEAVTGGAKKVCPAI